MKQLFISILLFLPSISFADQITAGPTRLDTSNASITGALFVDPADSNKISHYYINGPITTETVVVRRDFNISTRTWGSVITVYDDPNAGYSANGAPGGVIGNHIYLFFTRYNRTSDTFYDCGYIRSTDLTGTTWSSYTPVYDPTGHRFNAGPGGIIGTSNPNIWFQILYDHTGVTPDPWFIRQMKTTDLGESWTLGPYIQGPGSLKWGESTGVNFGNGNLLIVTRNESGGIGQSISTDDGLTWADMNANKTNLGSAGGKQIPTIYFDFPKDLILCAFHDRSDLRLKLSIVDPDMIFSAPTAWPATVTLDSGFTYFGYPLIAKIDEDEYLIVYSKEFGGTAGADIMWLTYQVTQEGDHVGLGTGTGGGGGGGGGSGGPGGGVNGLTLQGVSFGGFVDNTTPPDTNPPLISLAGNPSVLTEGQSSSLSWSTSNATTCTASGGWGGSKSISGNESVAPTSTTTYTLTCTGTGGTSQTSFTITVSSLPPPPPPTSTYIFYSNYENLADPTDLTPPWQAEQEPHAPGINGPTQVTRMTLVDSPASPITGKIMRVELRPYDSGNGDVQGTVTNPYNRAEVYARHAVPGSTPGPNWPDPEGSERWYGISVFVPADYIEHETNWLVFTQWKGYQSGSPPQALEIDGNQFELASGITGVSRVGLGNINKGQWTNFVVGIKYSPDETVGWIEIYKNGSLAYTRTNRPTMRTVTINGLTKTDPCYLKQGIYRAKEWTTTAVIYYGPTTIAATKEELSDYLQ